MTIVGMSFRRTHVHLPSMCKQSAGKTQKQSKKGSPKRKIKKSKKDKKKREEKEQKEDQDKSKGLRTVSSTHTSTDTYPRKPQKGVRSKKRKHERVQVHVLVTNREFVCTTTATTCTCFRSLCLIMRESDKEISDEMKQS